MNNLTTRKIVLGLLMTLVLAFSVQGIADAFTVTKSTKSVALLPIPAGGITSEQTFTFGIRFTTAEVNQGNDTPDDTNDPATISDDRITVTVSGTNATITSVKVGSLTDEDTTTVIPQNVDPTTTSYTVTVKYTMNAVGENAFTVTDATNSSDRVYTSWGVQRPDQVTTLQFAPTAPTVAIGYPNTNNEFYLDQEVTLSLSTATANVVVEFRRIWGTGSIYENLDADATRLDPGRNLTTSANAVTNASGAATVRLRVRNGSTLIRASIRGANLALDARTHDITYFYGGITLRKVSGEPQTATPSTQLAEPLVVEVRDWYPNSLSGTAIRDQEIDFTTTGGTGFRPHADNPDLNNVPGATGYPFTYPQETIKAKTDNRGQAKVYAVLGTDADADTFTATLTGSSSNTASFADYTSNGQRLQQA